MTATNFGAPTGTSNPDVGWRTPALAPLKVLSVPAPGGYGDVLVRTEVSVSLFAAATTASHLGFFPNCAVSKFLGDVGDIGDGPLDPWSDGPQDFAFSWERSWHTHLTNFDYLAGIVPTYCQCSTDGYVTSHASRGPASYGAVTPAFNLSVVTRGSDQYTVSTSSPTSTWVIVARCLWKTP